MLDSYLDEMVYGENKTGGKVPNMTISQSATNIGISPNRKTSISQMLTQRAETPVSQIASNLTHSREMLKKHQTLNKYYQKHMQSQKELAERKELREQFLAYEKNLGDEKKAKMEQMRQDKID